MDFSVLEPHLFRNAQLYAPEDLGHCDLLIAGGKIVAVEKAGHATTRPDCPESDLAGAVVCPGFIDQHVHLIGGGGEAGPHTRRQRCDCLRWWRLASPPLLACWAPTA